MTANKTNAARTRQYNKKQKNLVCDEQLDGEISKTNKGAEQWVYCSEEGCEIHTMLWQPKITPEKI